MVVAEAAVISLLMIQLIELVEINVLGASTAQAKARVEDVVRARGQPYGASCHGDADCGSPAMVRISCTAYMARHIYMIVWICFLGIYVFMFL
jgi:hypothetical protein